MAISKAYWSDMKYFARLKPLYSITIDYVLKAERNLKIGFYCVIILILYRPLNFSLYKGSFFKTFA